MSWSGNWICTSFRRDLFKAQHDFSASGGHTFKLALYDADATLSAATTDYSTTNEVTGTGYTAGGATLTNVEPTTGGLVGYTSFSDLTFSSVSISVRGALIYNTTTGGGAGTTDAVLVLDFGRTITKSAEDLVITFPTADQLNAILRNQAPALAY